MDGEGEGGKFIYGEGIDGTGDGERQIYKDVDETGGTKGLFLKEKIFSEFRT